jgi:transcriptional regulator EpsA
MSLSTICSSPAFPESLLRSFRVLTDGSATPLLQQWLALQKPIVVELNGDYQGMAPLWLTVLRQQNFKQASVHATFDLRGRRLIYMCFLDVGVKNPDATRRIMGILMPHIAHAVGQVYRSMRRKQEVPQTMLSLREREILKWVREGKTNKEISDILGLSFKTVKNHVENILSKLGVTNRAEAVAKALSQDFLESRLDLPTQGMQFKD